MYPQTASVSLTTSHRLPAPTFMKKYVISKRGVAIVLQMLMKSTRVSTPPCNNPIDAIYFSKQINKSVAVASFLLSSTTRRTSRNLGSFRRALYSYTGDAIYNPPTSSERRACSISKNKSCNLQPTNQYQPTYQATSLPTHQPSNLPSCKSTNLPTVQHPPYQ